MRGSAFLSSLLPVFFSSLFPCWVVVLKAVGCELTVAEHARPIWLCADRFRPAAAPASLPFFFFVFSNKCKKNAAPLAAPSPNLDRQLNPV